ncbi:hypothetical protein [Undibacterium sp. TS12]|uniref:hypothetical protein n=1 Tax=Undibacterium sp. TS12 TaxID=2908202 RepID=UPI001F4D115A|nr:hypothetical protein [Undibacterium sp. TS12]MCH8620408.1 hypothetical protein [Undibacterium sp. TS12]
MRLGLLKFLALMTYFVLSFAHADQFAFAGKLVDSRTNGYTYGYGPSIIYENGRYNMFYCSTGSNGAWDAVRYVSSSDGNTWSAPTIALGANTGATGDTAACDPSVVRYQAPGDAQPYYYLFYSGYVASQQTVIYVARSLNISGPYEKWTGGSNWALNPANPKYIIAPNHAQTSSSFYGAGEQTVVVVNNQLQMWYSDDTGISTRPGDACAGPCMHLFMTSAIGGNPTQWSAPTLTTGTGSIESVDVKYNDAQKTYVMYSTPNKHQANAYLVEQVSVNGIDWSSQTVLCNTNCYGGANFPAYSGNVGVSGDSQGHTIGNRTLVGYAAPYESGCTGNCWGQWDLFGGIVYSPAADTAPLTSAQSNSILWPVSALIDADYLSSYSSAVFPGATNANTFVAAWTAGQSVVRAIRLYARDINGKMQGFPPSYNVYLTAADNSSWVPIGTFSQQPDVTGVATITLPTSMATYGILIYPVTFGADNYGNRVFQLNGIELVK